MIDNYDVSNVIVPMLLKSENGKIDEDGNYIFEVEASNENLDLQNQIVQQKALIKSKDYFLSNGVISNDHLHKRRLPDGSVISDNDMVIGEPISVWTDGKQTFVKGKLYADVKAAKPYINLLKSHSSRVKASVGGILPKIRKNDDGTETVTGFMWNDLALTTSPVNSTVGSAVFAKSLTNQEFCKALTAEINSLDDTEKVNGAALTKEDTEKKVVDVIPESDNEEEEKEEQVKKSDIDQDNITECLICIKNGEFKSKRKVQQFFINKGYSFEKSIDITNEMIKEGGIYMAKGLFSNSISEILKSFGKKECKKSETDNEDSEQDDIDFDPAEDETPEGEPKDEDDEDVKKSNPFDDPDDSIDATEIIETMQKSITELTEKLDEKDSEIEDLKKSITDMAIIMKENLSQPQSRKSTMVNKSLTNGDGGSNSNRPSKAEFEEFKVQLCQAKKDGLIDMQKSVHLESVFQKAMNGYEMSKADYEACRNIHNKYSN